MTTLPEAKSKNVIYGLYCICHPGRGIRYVGQTSLGIKARMWLHRSVARVDPKQPVSYWMRKHSVDNIAFTTLEVAHSDQFLDDLEIRIISEHRSLGLADLNISDGGHGTRGWKMPEDVKNKIALKATGRKHSDETKALLSSYRGEQSSFYGKHHSNQIKEKTNANHPNRRLTTVQVLEIRARYDLGESPTKLAAEFSVTSSSIVQHGKRQTWVWLADRVN